MPTYPSLDYFTDIATRAGLPIGDLKQMRQAKPFAEYAISDVVGQDNGGAINGFIEDRKQKIQRLADMDSRLNQMFADPNSRFHTRNPFVLESALGTATNLVSNEAGGIDRSIQAEQQKQESLVNSVSKFYNDLIASIAAQKTGTGGENIDFEAEIANALGETSQFTPEEIEAIKSIEGGL